jgi:hypothetical protein
MRCAGVGVGADERLMRRISMGRNQVPSRTAPIVTRSSPKTLLTHNVEAMINPK